MAEYKSIRQVAEKIGISHKTASSHLRHKRFPLTRQGPWTDDDVAHWKIWAKETLRPNRADPEYQGRVQVEPPADLQDKDYWLTRKYRAQALEQEGKLLDTDAVLRAWAQTTGDIRDQILMVASAVQGLLGLTDEQTKQLDDYIRQTLTGVADRMGDLAASAGVIQVGTEGDHATEADAAERVGGDVSIHAQEPDGEPRPVEE